jgi:hypothetical protein
VPSKIESKYKPEHRNGRGANRRGPWRRQSRTSCGLGNWIKVSL